MNKLTILLAASIFASPVFAEEAKDVKVEATKPVEAAATEEAKAAPEAAVEETKKAAEPVAEEAKKEEPAAAAPEVKKDVKAKPAKKSKHGMKKHKKTITYTVVPAKKYKVVPVK